jgi:hypothetical protein
LVSVQPKLGPNSNLFSFDQEEACVAVTRKFKGLRDPSNIDLLAEDIRNDIDREILTDLVNNCATIKTNQSDLTAEQLWRDMGQINYEVSYKISNENNWRFPNWIVVHPIIYNRFTNIFQTYRFRYKVHVTESIRWNAILFGYKGERYTDSSYIWAPYIPLNVVQPIGDSLFGPAHIMRYGKKLMREGNRFFGKIELIEKADETVNKG